MPKTQTKGFEAGPNICSKFQIIEVSAILCQRDVPKPKTYVPVKSCVHNPGICFQACGFLEKLLQRLSDTILYWARDIIFGVWL